MSKINKTDQQWRDQLSEEEFYVTREKGTERPFTGKLLNENGHGVYHCKCCNQPLFFSEQKFESHCGWPSFDKCKDGAIGYVRDSTHGMQRVEIVCTKCDAHIGHVFDDGPTETGKRYCVNSLSLSFNKA